MNKSTISKAGVRLWTLPIAATAAATLLFGAAPEANASAVAYSNLSISNFTISNSAGTQYDASDFADLSVGNSTQASALINGSGSTSSHPSDVPLQCVGTDCGMGENDFSQQAGGFFSRGDGLLDGSIITGLPGPSEATAETVGEMRIEDGSATNSAEVGTVSGFEFALGDNDTITFDGIGDCDLSTSVTGGTGYSQATCGFTVSIVDLDTDSIVWTYTPDELNQTIGVSPNGSSSYDSGPVAINVTTPELSGGTNYVLQIQQTSVTAGEFSSTQVPEPSALLMLGAGLIGLGAVGRRRRA